ncbi:MAG: zinc-ribbon domain containing protein [Chloroflexota bacterium]|nr:zinc-ribbon domain containing protein [Dehalococcoidia bacterium]MDW8253971.1 zinc-ribbon domain containing protein [Chloroflexota bacterium]
MALQDKTLTCRDCGHQFVFTVSEQEFFFSKGFLNNPSRCQDCRASRKARIAAQAASGGAGPFSGTRVTSNGRREYTRATCSSCGGEALLPFTPRGDRPVYCSDCFDQVRSFR